MRYLFVMTIIACTTIFGAPLAAQKGKPTAAPASALFRCPGVDCPVEDLAAMPPVFTDAVRADFVAAYLPADGAKIDTIHEFMLNLAPTGRRLELDFSYGPTPCVGCRRTFQNIAIDDTHGALIHTNVIDPNTGDLAQYGLRSIPVGATWPARLKIAFNTIGASGETIQWAVRFNPANYAPSDHIRVIRIGVKEWVLYATAAERAMLVSVCCRQRGTTNEGLYVMPFQILVTEQ